MKPVIFCISLASKADDDSWAKLNECLGYTLRSILNQTDPNFSVLIACHDRPICPEMEDPRIEFLKAKGPRATEPSQFMGDKTRKRRVLADAVKARGGGYMVMHDGDDILHARLVEYFRTIDSPHGYVYTKGYVLDYVEHNLAPVPGVWDKPFGHVCGSSAAIWFNPEDFDAEDGEESYFRKFKNHSGWASVAEAAGRPLHEVEFPCCIYVQNNAVNISAHLQRSKERVIELMGITRKLAVPLTEDLIHDFALEWMTPGAAVGNVRAVDENAIQWDHPEPLSAAASSALLHVEALRSRLAPGLSPEPAKSRQQRAKSAEAMLDVVGTLLPVAAVDVFVDIGANTGAVCKAIRKRNGEIAIIAVDGNSGIPDQVVTGLAAANIEAVHACIGDSSGTAEFFIPIRKNKAKGAMGGLYPDSWADSHTSRDEPICTLDELMAGRPGNIMLWIDAEGAAHSIVKSGPETLKQCKIIYVVTESRARWEGQALAGDVIASLVDAGFVPLALDVRREWQFGILFVRSDLQLDSAVQAKCANLMQSDFS